MLTGMEKPTPSLTPVVAGNGRVDADHFAVEIDQGAAAVAGIDGRVGLQEILKDDRVGVAQGELASPFGADDSKRDGMAQPEGAAHRQHEVANLHPIAVAQGRGGQIGRRNRQHRHVGGRILRNLRRVDASAVGQIDPDGRRRSAADHVPVGQHVVVALQFDNHAGAGFFHMPGVVVGRVGLGRDVGLDVNHGRPNQLGHNFQYGRLGLEQMALMLQFPLQFGPLLGPGRFRPFQCGGQGGRGGRLCPGSRRQRESHSNRPNSGRRRRRNATASARKKEAGFPPSAFRLPPCSALGHTVSHG